MSVLLRRGAALETLSVEPFDDLDGQGKPSYDSAQPFEATAIRRDEFQIQADGSRIDWALTLWVDADQDPGIAVQDRVTRGGETFVVIEKRPVRRLRSASLDHTRYRCREE